MYERVLFFNTRKLTRRVDGIKERSFGPQHNRKLYIFDSHYIVQRSTVKHLQQIKRKMYRLINALVVFNLLIQTDPGYDSSDAETLSILRESDVLMAQIAEFQRETLAIQSKYLFTHDFFFALFVLPI